MRSDFNKVLTERPRAGHKRKHKDTRKKYNSSFDPARWDEIDDGQYGGCQGMKKPYDDRKTSTDLWSAIRRFMASRVGRLWDDVWSEVNRDLRESDDMRAHWRVHCKIEVDEKVSVAPNGKLWRIAGRGSWIFASIDRDGWPVKGIPGCNKRFYVDPRDGILYETPKTVWNRQPREVEQPYYGWDMGDGVSIKYIDGIWYAVEFEAYTLSKPVPIYGPYDRTYKREILGYKSVLETHHHLNKRQLSTKELRRYGVANNP